MPNGQTWFVRDGRLCFDIGWVGVVTGKAKVNDDRWHQVVVNWQQSDHRLRLYVDGKLDGEGTLAAKAALTKGVVRIGFTAPDFPRPASFFQGEIEEVRFYRWLLTKGLERFARIDSADTTLVARWLPGKPPRMKVVDTTGSGNDATVHHGTAATHSASGPIVAGFAFRRKHAGRAGPARMAACGLKNTRRPSSRWRFSVWLPSDLPRRISGLRTESDKFADSMARRADPRCRSRPVGRS